MKKLVGSVLALAALAGAAQAATVTVSGAVNVGPLGNSSAVGIGLARQDNIPFTTNGGASVVGVSRQSNAVSPDQQCLELTLTQFTFAANSAGTYNLTVTMTQDYVLDAGATGLATGSHQINGNANFSTSGQSVAVSASSTHESTALPNISTGTVNSAGAGTVALNAGQGPTTNIAITGALYTITATYNFTITMLQGGSVSIVLPDSGVDNACLALVPLPPAAWAGLGGLAFVGAGATVRRRRLSRA